VHVLHGENEESDQLSPRIHRSEHTVSCVAVHAKSVGLELQTEHREQGACPLEEKVNPGVQNNAEMEKLSVDKY